MGTPLTEKISESPAKNWGNAMMTLGTLLLIALAANLMIWFSLISKNWSTDNGSETAQNQVPKTDQDKTKLLNSLAAAHSEAVTQSTMQARIKVINNTSHATSTMSDKDKMRILDALKKAR